MIEIMTPPIIDKTTKNGKAIALDIGGKCYRLRRRDALNIVLERWHIPADPVTPGAESQGPQWRIDSYLGNSPRAIVRSLTEAIVSEHTPIADDQLTDQLRALHQTVEDGTKAITAALSEVNRL